MMRSSRMGYEARGDHAIRAIEILEKCLGSGVDSVHPLRSRALLCAVEAMVHGQRLTPIDFERVSPVRSEFVAG